MGDDKKQGSSIFVDVPHGDDMLHGEVYTSREGVVVDYALSSDGLNLAVLVAVSTSKDMRYGIDVQHLPSGIKRTLVSVKDWKKDKEGESLNLSEIQFTGTRVFVHGTGGWMECCEDGRYRQTSYHGDSKKVTASPNNDYKVETLDEKLLITGIHEQSSEAKYLKEEGLNPHWDPSDVGMRYVKIPEQPKPAEEIEFSEEMSPTPDVVPVPPTLKEAIRQVKEEQMSKSLRAVWYNPLSWFS